MKFTKESVLKSLNSLTMPAWIKRVFQLIVDYIDDAASSDFSNGINTLNNIVKVAYIGIVNNLDDIAEGDQTGLNQTGMGQLFSFLINYKSYRNSYIEFENEDIDSRLCRIIDINGGKRQFTIYNNGALQTYKQLNTGGKYSLKKISDIPGYIYFDYNDASSNKIAANSLKTNKAVPALLAINEYVFIGYCTKINEGTTAFIVFNKQTMATYSMNNLAGTFIPINKIDTDTIVNYDSIRGSKTNAEAKQELTNILAGNTFVINASKLGTTLTNEEAATVQEATTLIVTNIADIGTLVFNRGDVNNTEIHFNAVFMAFMGSIYARRILYNKDTKILNAIQAQISNPFQWYMANNGIINSQSTFTALNNFLYDHTFIIDKTLLNTTISDTTIQNGIKRANILVVKDSTDNSYVLYIKGVVNTNLHFFYNINIMISTSIDIKRIEFKTSTNLLSASVVYFSSVFKSYQLGGGTKYTSESAFNTQFAKVIDMTVTQ